MIVKNKAYEAEIKRNPFTGKWVVCKVQGNLVESADCAARRAEFRTRKEAKEVAESNAAYALQEMQAFDNMPDYCPTCGLEVVEGYEPPTPHCRCNHA